jgi:hypothetical protein
MNDPASRKLPSRPAIPHGMMPPRLTAPNERLSPRRGAQRHSTFPIQGSFRYVHPRRFASVQSGGRASGQAGVLRPRPAAMASLASWAVANRALAEPKENKWLLAGLFWQRFFYRQLMYYVAIKSTLASVRGVLVGWGKLERKATVKVQQAH